MKSNKHSWEDFLFENRNRAYGAYEIRTSADRTLLKALLVVIFTLGIIITAFSSSSDEKPVIYDSQKPPIHNLKKIEENFLPSVKPKVQKPVVVTVKKKSGSDVMPDPVSNPKIEKPFSEQIDLGITEGPENTGNPGDVGALNLSGTTDGGGDGTIPVENPISNMPEIPKTLNARTVTKMAVFPGCENAGQSKKELTDCMSKKLNQELVSQLNDFEDIAKRNNLSEAISQMNFVVDRNGKIVEIKTLGNGNKELGNEAQRALDRISRKLIKQGKLIKPAQNEDGEAVNMIFSLPVRYQSN